jgi:hypothetical protein
MTKRGPSRRTNFRIIAVSALAMLNWSSTLQAQMIDNTPAPNIAKAGINKSLPDEIGFLANFWMTIHTEARDLLRFH